MRYTFDGVPITGSSNGNYSGTVIGIDVGTYDIFLKGFAHLQKRFAEVTLEEGSNNRDFSQTILLAGDVNSDDRINTVDIGMTIQDYFPATPPESPADTNLDGTVNALDIGLIVENYFLEGDK